MLLTTLLVDFRGKPIETAERICPTCGRAIAPARTTLGDVLINALASERPKESIPGAEKMRRYRLGMRMGAADEITLTAEEIVLCKTQVEKFYPAVIYGQVCDLLEPEAESKKS